MLRGGSGEEADETMIETELYNTIRLEIVNNQILMQWITLITAILLLIGAAYVEKHTTILSLFLPLFSLSWAAAMVRFDFFIHRQGAYLRALEAKAMSEGNTLPLWETWKDGLQATKFVLPSVDILAVAVIVIPTIFILFGPARAYFVKNKLRGARLYAWSMTSLLFIPLISLSIIPTLAGW